MCILEINKITTELAANQEPLVSGRYEFQANVERAPRAEVVLRIDPDGHTISGDVFSPNPAGSVQRLGGRTDWDYSFKGDLKTYEDGRHLATCTVLGRSGNLRPDNGVMAGVAEIKINAEQQPRAMSFNLFADSNQGVSKLAAWKNRTKIALTSQTYFRRIGLTIGVSQRAVELHEILRNPLFLEQFRDGLREAAALSRIELDIHLLAEPRAPVIPDGFAGEVQDQARDLLAGVLMEHPEQNFDDVDWSHVVLIHTARRTADQPVGLGGLLGQAFGLGEAQDRFLSRYGAMLNAEAIDAMFIKRQDPDLDGGFHYLDGMDDEDARFERTLSATIRLAMHELGHLLNLPHPWSRATSNRFLGPSDPASASVTNYPHRRPFGLAASYALKGNDIETRTAIRDANIAELNDPDHVRFDEIETGFIWHAPLPLIAQGGRTFADHHISPPQIRPQHSEPRLVIGLPNANGDLTLANEISRSIIRDSDGFFEYQPTPGNLILQYLGEPGEENRPDFNMMNGAVQFYIYEDRDPIVNGALEPRKTVVYDADYLFDRAIFDASGNRLCSSNCAPNQAAHPLDPPEPEGSGKSKMDLPWFNDMFIDSAFKGVRRKLKIQAVFFKDTVNLYRSNILSINFDRVSALPDPKPPNYRNWIADPESRHLNRDDFEAYGNANAALV